jgi:hypothetical protein
MSTKLANPALSLVLVTLTSPMILAQSGEDLPKRAIERRAIEAVIWGMPAANYELMLHEMLTKTDGKVNQIIYWSRPLDWKNQTLTPNPDGLLHGVLQHEGCGPDGA